MSEQVAYYRARAVEYDDWFERRGRYDRGIEINSAWKREVEQLRRAMDDYSPSGRILELAAGTGIWTERLAQYTQELTVVDAAPEMIAMNRAKLGKKTDAINYVEADIFNWRSNDSFDFVFFGFWLSHIPDQLFDHFWNQVRTYLAPAGRVFFVDSLDNSVSRAVNHPPPDDNSGIASRQLNDGREFKVVKVFYDPGELQDRLSRLGWDIIVQTTPNFFLYGCGTVTNM